MEGKNIIIVIIGGRKGKKAKAWWFKELIYTGQQKLIIVNQSKCIAPGTVGTDTNTYAWQNNNLAPGAEETIKSEGVPREGPCARAEAFPYSPGGPTPGRTPA